MNNLRILVTILVAAVALSAAGCNTKSGLRADSSGSQQPVDRVLMPEPNPPIADLPVPIYFKLDEAKSRDYAATNARHVDHIYYGSASKYDVRRFYRLEMEQYGWTCEVDRATVGVLKLRFAKGAESCDIVISDRFHLLRPTQIHLEMWSTGRLPPPPIVAP